MLVGTIKDGIGSRRLEPGDKVHPAIRAADRHYLLFDTLKVIPANKKQIQIQHMFIARLKEKKYTIQAIIYK